MAIKHLEEQIAPSLSQEITNLTRPSICRSLSDVMFTKYQCHTSGLGASKMLSGESRDRVDDTTLPKLSRSAYVESLEDRHSYSTIEDLPPDSRSSSPRLCLSSSATSTSVFTMESFAPSARAPSSVLSRLRSSISSSSTSGPTFSRPSIHPLEFRTPSEQPEKRFVDSIGVVCPGVSDRAQCFYPLAHFVSTFRICEPIEYTTAWADHGLTYTDYCRLLSVLKNFLEDYAGDAKSKIVQRVSTSNLGYRQPVVGSQESLAKGPHPHGGTFLDTTEQLGKARRQADILNQLLEDVTFNLRARGTSVVVCVSSFSLFAPHRISEAHVQILHAHFAHESQTVSEIPDPRSGQRLSFIDAFSFATAERRSVSNSRPKLEGRSQSEHTTYMQCSKYHHQTSQNRDRSRPWPLWPNAIPSRKRQAMHENADRYGADPFFRAYLRANINARTTSSTYAKYMIEQEDNPFVNRRLEYIDTASRGALARDMITHGPKAWKEQFPSVVNRAKYQHNRRLECRKIVEQGSRLRILRFGFRYAIYPIHTPEMEELGLTKSRYQKIISDIADIHTNAQLYTKCPISYLLSSLNKIRRRSTEDALMKVNEYIRELNASQRRVVWTIEKIPGVYDRGLARDRTEWEISAWNGEDPLELLIELERWGIIEQRLNLEDDE
jgi:hypothetical protein